MGLFWDLLCIPSFLSSSSTTFIKQDVFPSFLGLPFANFSAQIKAFMDRVGHVCIANGGLLRRKVGASVLAVRRAGALPAFHSLNSFFTAQEMIVVGSSYWNMGFGFNKGEVEKDEEGIRTMRNLGINMAWVLKSLIRD